VEWASMWGAQAIVDCAKEKVVGGDDERENERRE
jgi:hypothetical protein